MRKPFDVLAEGLLVQAGRGDRTWLELFITGIAELEPTVLKRIIAA
jgi:hypothetical protein